MVRLTSIWRIESFVAIARYAVDGAGPVGAARFCGVVCGFCMGAAMTTSFRL